jgi:hypothetical protein
VFMLGVWGWVITFIMILIPSHWCSKFLWFSSLCPCSCEVVLLGTYNMGLGRCIRNGVLTVSTPCSVLSRRNFQVTMKEAAVTSTSFLFPISLFQLFNCSLPVHLLKYHAEHTVHFHLCFYLGCLEFRLWHRCRKCFSSCLSCVSYFSSCFTGFYLTLKKEKVKGRKPCAIC